MLKIGAFSKLTQVSIRMLRHYNETGLLKPAHVDSATGYRYYTADQLPQLHRILALQDLGFSLKQIATILENPLPADQLRGMILQKHAELEDHVRQEQERLARASAHLEMLETNGTDHNVVIKTVQKQKVASIRDIITSHDTVGYLFDALFAFLAPPYIAGMKAVIWHDDSFNESEIDAEALVYLSETFKSKTERVKVYELPEEKMASVIHRGSFLQLPRAYDKLIRWLDSSGYQITGANRELYHHYVLPPNPADESYVTEIQFPIAQSGEEAI